MKTVLFNTILNEIVSSKQFEDGYNNYLPEHIIELEVIETPAPDYDVETQRRIKLDYLVDVDNKTYTAQWQVIDLTEEELIERINNNASSELQNIDVPLVNKLLRKQIEDTPEEDMHEYTPLFLPFIVGESVKNATDSDTGKADIRRWKGQLYKCIISHTTQLDWTPDVYTAGWNKVAEPGEIPEWSSFASHEFANMDIGTPVMDEGTVYYLINPSQGHWKPSSNEGYLGWSTAQP